MRIIKGLRIVTGTFIAVLVIGGPMAYSSMRLKQIRNFRVVDEGILYRSGQMSVKALARTIDEYRIKTVISLRGREIEDQKPFPDEAEEKYCRNLGINYIRIRPKRWTPREDGSIPAVENLELFRKIMKQPKNYPVLVHCFAGIHRTGAMCATYRIDFQNWSNENAIHELKRLGYVNLDSEGDILGYFEHYQKQK